MSDAEAAFHAAMDRLKAAQKGKMFGWPGYKVGGKFFAYFGKGAAVFKLPADMVEDALELEGASRFDPGGKGRFMREWVVVPARHEALWEGFAAEACAFVDPDRAP